jgi:hypothetical protein
VGLASFVGGIDFEQITVMAAITITAAEGKQYFVVHLPSYFAS